MAQARVLADRLIPHEGLAWDALRIAAGNLLLVLCAQLTIPLPWTPVPITGQTFGVLVVAVLLGPTRAAVTLSLYLLEGFAGLPVFSPIGPPGPLRLVGATAGYLYAYPFAAWVTGWLVETPRLGERVTSLRLLGALAAGASLILLTGWAWQVTMFAWSWQAAFFTHVAPFLPVELAKIATAFALVRGLYSTTNRGAHTA